MCKCCSKSKVKAFGIATNVCLAVLIFVCIFLVGFDYREAHQNWTSNGGWRHLGVVQVTAVVIAFVVIILGFLIFSCLSEIKPAVGIYVGLNSLSMLFTMAISIFALVGGVVGDFDDYVGCNTQYKRMLMYWRSIDNYFIMVDRMFCSRACTCHMNSYIKKMFSDDPFANNIFEKWDTSNTNEEMINFQQCTDSSKKIVLDGFNKIEKETYQNGITDFDDEKFATFWGHIEDRFECTGWCTTAYQGDPTEVILPSGITPKTTTEPTQMMLYKYLFSDVNKGIVKNRGCLRQILLWLPRVMLAYGSLTLFASIFQVLGFLFALSLLMGSYLEDNDYDTKVQPKRPEEDQDELKGNA